MIRTAIRRVVLTLPMVAVFGAVGFTVLHAYAPLEHSPHFQAPRVLSRGAQGSSYALGRVAGGWGLVESDGAGRLIYRRYEQGRTSTDVLARSSTADGMPSLAAADGRTLVVWVHDVGGNAALNGMLAGRRGPHKAFTLIPPTGSVENPDVFAGARGGFDIVFSWQRQALFDLYLMRVSSRGAHVLLVKRLVRATGYAFDPHATLDAAGHIHLVYMDMCCKNHTWQVLGREFTASGRPLGRRQILSSDVPEISGSPGSSTTIPLQWGIDVRPANDGSVWAAWEAGSRIDLLHWSRDGSVRKLSHFVANDLDMYNPAVQVVPQRNGCIVFYGAEDGLQSNVMSVWFDSQAREVQTERVEYARGVTVRDPKAVALPHSSLVVWQQVPDRGDTAALQMTSSRPVRHAGLAEQLGMGVGPAWIDGLLLVTSAAIAGAGLTVVNALFLIPLILAWLPAAKFVPRKCVWAVYVGLIGLVLALAFALRTILSAGTVVVGPFQQPIGWIVVAGAVFAGYWVGRAVLRDDEPIFRASLTALSAFYFVAFMWTLIGFEAEIGHV